MAPAGCPLCVLVLCPVVVGSLVVLVCSVFSRWTLHHSSSSPSASSSWQPPHNQQAATQQRNTTARTGHAAFFWIMARKRKCACACVRALAWSGYICVCARVCCSGVRGGWVGGYYFSTSINRFYDFTIGILPALWLLLCSGLLHVRLLKWKCERCSIL